MFDARTETLARDLLPDQFCDTMRAQITANGVDVVVLSLWGDLRITPRDPEYNDMIKETAPIYAEPGDHHSGGRLASYAADVEEPAEYFNPVMRMPSQEWWSEFLQSYWTRTGRTDFRSTARWFR